MSDWTLFWHLLLAGGVGYLLTGFGRVTLAAMRRSVAEDDAGSGRWLIP